MYIPKKFEQSDLSQCRELIDRYPFVTLITHSDAGLEAHHLPLLLQQVKGEYVLQGHIAKVNPLWKTLEDNADVLLVFSGPNCYISPNHYPTKKETGKAVPTWNYVSVHVKGVISYIHDEQWILNNLDELTSKHEAGSLIPWSMADAPAAYIQKMLPAIVGVEIAVLSMTGQWKASQNQPEINQQGVMLGLSQSAEGDAKKMAEIVRRHGARDRY